LASILRPRTLRNGDTVAIAALSGELGDEAGLFEHGLASIRQMGFEVRVSPLVDRGQRWWWAAGRPQVIADEFNRLLRDPDIRAIFALTGGRTTLSYLDLIDYEAIRADPKPILGFSDIDAVHLAAHARTGLVTIHGDLVTYGFGYWHEADESRRMQLADIYVRVLTSSEPAGILPPGGEWERWRSGRAQGPLVGALLTRFVEVQATPFALGPERFDGAILFWESLATSFAVIWNELHVLRLAGVFDQISGMIVGTPWEVTTSEGGPDTLREVVLDVLGDRDIPVLGNVDIGHNPPNVPLPIGVRAELDADARTISLLEPAVSPRPS
jgi:muramoyltetrapeptide carboxypeptidase